MPSAAPRKGGSSKPPRRLEDRLEDALADAEKMARRVERLEEQDAFAASLLAAEYLARTEQADVNPLEQRGRTDAWTSAFVRLRLMADRGKKYEGFESEAPLYVAARSEERRLDALLGRDAVTTLAKARAEARRVRRHRATTLGLAVLGPCLAALAAWAATDGPYAREALLGLGVVTLLAVAVAVRAASRGAAITKHAGNIARLERAFQERAVFEASPTGRFVIQKMHEAHPHLLRNVSVPAGAVVRSDAG